METQPSLSCKARDSFGFMRRSRVGLPRLECLDWALLVAGLNCSQKYQDRPYLAQDTGAAVLAEC